MSTLPKITAVMVTGKDPARNWLARAAVESFKLQQYPNKELLVINDGDSKLLSDYEVDSAVRELHVPRQRTLGDLRNIGLDEAAGEWLMQWDDDDWSHPDRMSYQASRMNGVDAVLLRCQIRYSFLNNCARIWRWTYNSSPAIPGTILHRRDGAARYRSEGIKEDEYFLKDHFSNRVQVIENTAAAGCAHYYTRFFHGHNTWDEQHVMGQHYASPHRNRWSLDAVCRDYLKLVLAAHYGR